MQNVQLFKSDTTKLGLLQDRLIQDELTRWNSSLYILQQIIQQKVALAAYGTKYSVVQLTSHQLELATKVIAALSPILKR